MPKTEDTSASESLGNSRSWYVCKGYIQHLLLASFRVVFYKAKTQLAGKKHICFWESWKSCVGNIALVHFRMPWRLAFVVVGPCELWRALFLDSSLHEEGADDIRSQQMTSTRVARWHLSDLPLMSFWAHKLCSWAHLLNMQNKPRWRLFFWKSNWLQPKCPAGVARSPDPL